MVVVCVVAGCVCDKGGLGRRYSTKSILTSASGLNAPLPIVAPSFPIAAQNPFIVVRMFEGNVSAGRMNVVLFGPKFEKKNVSE